MTLYRLRGAAPDVPRSAYVAKEATLIGRVILGERASVWAGAVLRGDNEPIRIGAASNIQEGAVLHTDADYPLVVADRVTVGHQAMLHGCTIGEELRQAEDAVVLNGARIGRNCLVGARALVTENKVFPDGSLIVGAPAVVKRQLSDADVVRLEASAEHYAERAGVYLNELEPLG